MSEPFDKPLVVIALDEGGDDDPGLVERVEPMEPEALFLERAHEALDHTVTLRLADERGTVRDPEPRELAAKRIGDILRAPITTNRESPRDVFPERAEGVTHALVNGFERGPPIADLGHMPPHDVIARVIDRAEEPAPAVPLGVEPRGIGAPHDVGPLGGDRADVRGVAVRMTGPLWRQEPVEAHQAEHAILAHAPAVRPQPHAHLAMPFPVKGRLGQHGADRGDQVVVGTAGPRPSFAGHHHHDRSLRIHGRPWHAEHRAHHRQGIAAARRGTRLGRHRPRFRSSAPYPFFSSSPSASSSRIMTSPSFAWTRFNSRSSGSMRFFKLCVPPSRNTRRHSSSAWAGTWLSRATASSGSPRNSRTTSSVFRDALQRSGISAGASAPAGAPTLTFSELISILLDDVRR